MSFQLWVNSVSMIQSDKYKRLWTKQQGFANIKQKKHIHQSLVQTLFKCFWQTNVRICKKKRSQKLHSLCPYQFFLLSSFFTANLSLVVWYTSSVARTEILCVMASNVSNFLQQQQHGYGLYPSVRRPVYTHTQHFNSYYSYYNSHGNILKNIQTKLTLRWHTL